MMSSNNNPNPNPNIARVKVDFEILPNQEEAELMQRQFYLICTSMKNNDPTDKTPGGNFKYDNLEKFRCGWETNELPPQTKVLHCKNGIAPFNGEWTMQTKVTDNKIFDLVTQTLCADEDAEWKTLSS